MRQHLIKRRAHWRRLRSKGATPVRESWVVRGSVAAGQGGSYRHPCPVCGSEIISVSMRNGGWAHFNGAAGLTRIKHHCLHLGEGLSKQRDDMTLDLFRCMHA